MGAAGECGFHEAGQVNEKEKGDEGDRKPVRPQKANDVDPVLGIEEGQRDESQEKGGEHEVEETAEEKEILEGKRGDNEEKTEDNEENEDVGEEGLVAVRMKEIKAPSTEEMRVHRATHLPFRSWCPECVAGRSKDSAHSKISDEESERQ